MRKSRFDASIVSNNDPWASSTSVRANGTAASGICRGLNVGVECNLANNSAKIHTGAEADGPKRAVANRSANIIT
jgi:hypothetical protein